MWRSGISGMLLALLPIGMFGLALNISSAADLGIEDTVLPYPSPQIYVGAPYGWSLPVAGLGDPSWWNRYNINVTVANRGTADAGRFNVSFSAYLEGELVLEHGRMKTVEGLQQGFVEILTFDFNPEYYGNYTLTITADCDNDIAESDEANNAETVWIIGTIPGDMRGDASGTLCDGDVDYYDFVAFAASYLKCKGQLGFNPLADIDWDGDVDYDDFIWFAYYYGKHVPA